MAVSHQHLRESQVLHSDYYSKKKKTASGLRKRIQHAAMRAIGATASRPSIVVQAPTRTPRGRSAPDRRAFAKTIVKWAFHARTKVCVQSRRQALDSIVATAFATWNRGLRCRFTL
jgi:hypothetical protein